MDLDKQQVETFKRLEECSLKYDVCHTLCFSSVSRVPLLFLVLIVLLCFVQKMKNSRNKLANLTQTYSQALAEMKEKIKIQQNEVRTCRCALLCFSCLLLINKYQG